MHTSQDEFGAPITGRPHVRSGSALQLLGWIVWVCLATIPTVAAQPCIGYQAGSSTFCTAPEARPGDWSYNVCPQTSSSSGYQDEYCQALGGTYTNGRPD